MFQWSIIPRILKNVLLYFTFFQVQISKPSKSSDNDEDEFDESDEEMYDNKSHDEDTDAEECGQIEGPTLRIGVTPFLSRVIPAGKLRARTKPVGCKASGLIQVRLKSLTVFICFYLGETA